MNNFIFSYLSLNRFIKILLCDNYYKSISSSPDYNTKYIYFPGNYEPELKAI